MRRGARLGVLFAVVLTVLAGLSAFTARADVADGGFESGYLRDAPEVLPSFGVWTRLGSASRLVNPPLPVHTGEWALEVDTRNSYYGSAVFQDFDTGTSSYVWTFWVLPQEGYEVAEIVYNWDRGAGYSQPGTEIVMFGTSTRFVGWGVMAILRPVPIGEWHKVTVVADRCSGLQTAFLDGLPWGQVQLPATETPPSGTATVILGDTPYTARHGLYYFDDVSFVSSECAPLNMCPRTHGFWLRHPDLWPLVTLDMGGRSYAIGELLPLLKMRPGRDASLVLGHELTAAKLNLASGSDPEPVRAAVADADAILYPHTEKIPLGVDRLTPEGQGMMAIADVLAAYNSGKLTPTCVSWRKAAGSLGASPALGSLAQDLAACASMEFSDAWDP